MTGILCRSCTLMTGRGCRPSEGQLAQFPGTTATNLTCGQEALANQLLDAVAHGSFANLRDSRDSLGADHCGESAPIDVMGDRECDELCLCVAWAVRRENELVPAAEFARFRSGGEVAWHVTRPSDRGR